jgi:hypothetical protein
MPADRSTASAPRFELITPSDTAASAVISSCRALVPTLDGSLRLVNNHGDDVVMPVLAGVEVHVTITPNSAGVAGWIRLMATNSTSSIKAVRLHDG